jgi:hypothetical protein
MKATFRHRRGNRNVSLMCVPVFLAWGVLGAYLALTDPKIPDRLAALALLAGVPLFMAGLGIWTFAAYWRSELSIRGIQIVSQGVVRRKAIDLPQVTDVRWRPRQRGGRVVLRNESVRLGIELGNYELDERAEIVRHLRETLGPDVQTWWNLFAYKSRLLEPRSTERKPGPDEVLVRRDRWDRYMRPAVVLATLAGMVAWRITGKPGFLALPLFMLAAWAMIRWTTPPEGMIAKKLSSLACGHAKPFFAFLVVWFLVFVAGLIVHEVFRPGLMHPDAFLIVGMIVWLAILLWEAWLQDRRDDHRDRAAAALAAKARGETAADPWHAELSE